MSVEIMIDLETLGVSHEATIIQIGACVFNPWSDTWAKPPRKHQFLANVRRDNGRPDLSTVKWWQTQQSLVQPNTMPLPEALLHFNSWLEGVSPEDERIIWSNGPGFDHTILNVAYDSLRASPPWKYNSGRCCRTVFDLAANFGWKRPQRPVAHNGLQDSLDQAKEVWQAIHFLKSWINPEMEEESGMNSGDLIAAMMRDGAGS